MLIIGAIVVGIFVFIIIFLVVAEKNTDNDLNPYPIQYIFVPALLFLETSFLFEKAKQCTRLSKIKPDET